MKCIVAWLAWLALAGTSVSAPAADNPPAAEAPVELLAGVLISVGADGGVTKVEPDTTLADPIQKLMVARISQWRYEPAKWQGRAVATSEYQVLRLQALPTTQGGFVLRVMRTEGEGELHADTGQGISPPKYPLTAQMHKAEGTFVYLADVSAEGMPGNVRLLIPAEQDMGKDEKSMAAAGKHAMESAKLRPFMADGVAVACDWLMPIIFSVGTNMPDKPATDAMTAPYRERLANPCPAAKRTTKIENTQFCNPH